VEPSSPDARVERFAQRSVSDEDRDDTRVGRPRARDGRDGTPESSQDLVAGHAHHRVKMPSRGSDEAYRGSPVPRPDAGHHDIECRPDFRGGNKTSSSDSGSSGRGGD
jgi:hypothetical protein